MLLTEVNTDANILMENSTNEFNETTRTDLEIVVLTIILASMLLIAFIGNLAVVYAIFKTPSLREQKYNYFLINLSITDMGTSIFVTGTSLVAIATDIREMHPIWCNICCAINYCLIIVSMLTMTFISIGCYVAIVHPLVYRVNFTLKIIFSLMAYTWLQGIAFGISPVVLNWIEYDYWETICAVNWHRKQAFYYVIVACSMCFFIPGSAILFNYSCIMWEAHKNDKHNSDINRWQLNRKKQAHKVIRSLLVVIVLFFICMAPFCLTKLLKVVYHVEYVPGYVNIFASFMQFTASAINPFIYAIFREDFRNSFQIIWWDILNKICKTNSERPRIKRMSKHYRRGISITNLEKLNENTPNNQQRGSISSISCQNIVPIIDQNSQNHIS